MSNKEQSSNKTSRKVNDSADKETARLKPNKPKKSN